MIDAKRAAHTPGPWLLECETVYALQDSDPPWYKDGKLQKENRFYALVQHRPKVGREERVATARLMSAAPELYEALKAAQEELRLIRMKDHGTIYNPCLSVQIMLALAKAGEP